MAEYFYIVHCLTLWNYRSKFVCLSCWRNKVFLSEMMTFVWVDKYSRFLVIHRIAYHFISLLFWCLKESECHLRMSCTGQWYWNTHDNVHWLWARLCSFDIIISMNNQHHVHIEWMLFVHSEGNSNDETAISLIFEICCYYWFR